MENLVSRWKNAKTSMSGDRSKSNLNSNSKNKYQFSSSSDSDSPSPKQKSDSKSRYLLPTKTEVTSTGLASSPLRKKENKHATALQTPGNENYPSFVHQSLRKHGTPTSTHEKSERKIHKNASNTEPNADENASRYSAHASTKKGIPFLIDQASYKIMDIFKYNNDLNNQEKLQRVKKVVEDVVENASSKTEELENQINNLRQETKRMSLMSRTDTSSKIVNELEARLCESEREKLQLKKDKEQLSGQLIALKKESDLNSTNSELLQMLLKNQKLLEENNAQLLKQLEQSNKREEEQQFIWQNEVSNLKEIFKMLKEQLIINEV